LFLTFLADNVSDSSAGDESICHSEALADSDRRSNCSPKVVLRGPLNIILALIADDT
jgi:hypothetical protein